MRLHNLEEQDIISSHIKKLINKAKKDERDWIVSELDKSNNLFYIFENKFWKYIYGEKKILKMYIEWEILQLSIKKLCRGGKE